MNKKLVAVIITSLAMTHSLQPVLAMEVHKGENTYRSQIDITEADIQQVPTAKAKI